MIDWTSVVKAFPKSAQKHMRRPDKWKDIPSLNDGYLMWAPPNVNRAYLLEDVTGNLNGWELSFDPKVRTKRRAEMCDLCKFVHGGRSCGVAFFSIPLSKQKTIGLYICADFACSSRCDETGVNAMRESLTPAEKLTRLHGNVFDLILRLHAETRD